MVLGDMMGHASAKASPGMRDMHKVEQPLELWEPPPAGWLKLNVDGAFAEQKMNGGAGMVLRDTNGQISFLFMPSLVHLQ